jgi:methylthioribose-1-phosphate isomerase
MTSIVALGGTVNPGSSTEQALRLAAAIAEEAGAKVQVFGGEYLTSLPHYLGPEHNATWGQEMVEAVRQAAEDLAQEEVDRSRSIGAHGFEILSRLAAQRPGRALNILTHCNAGWLAFVDHGSATAPIYAAHAAGIPVHVWVDETRPRNQGARLTAWELAHQNIPHTVIADNTGGHLMQHGLVDLVITGADRVTRSGDVANKIGTYLKALAARDNQLPFYVALPTSTFDWTLTDGLAQIPIEARSSDELIWMDGPDASGTLHRIRLIPDSSPAANHAFDVTPARLVTGLITEHGLIPANEKAIATLQQHTA